MPAPLRIDLSPADRAAVCVAFDTTRDADTRLRYQMVLLAAGGRAAPQIAPLVQRSEATVQRVLHRYRDGGLAAVPYRPIPGAAPAVPPTWGAELRRVIELDPREVGVASPLWTTGLLATYLAAQTGHAASDETVRRYLHRFDYVCKRPKWTLKRKAEEQPDWAGNGWGWRRCSRPRPTRRWRPPPTPRTPPRQSHLGRCLHPCLPPSPIAT